MRFPEYQESIHHPGEYIPTGGYTSANDEFDEYYSGLDKYLHFDYRPLSYYVGIGVLSLPETFIFGLQKLCPKKS